MESRLASLPPEMILHIAGFLDQGSLCSVLRVARFLHFLLWPVLYKRELAKPSPVGFIRCIRAGSVTALSKFIEVGADVNQRVDMGLDLEDFKGYTYPLATAAVRGQAQIVDVLLQNGADAEAKIDGCLCYAVLAYGLPRWASVVPNTPLSAAVAMGHDEIAIALARRVKPGSMTWVGGRVERTALEQAALCLRPSVVRQLLERGANPNKQWFGDQVGILHMLLEHHDMHDYADCTPGEERLLMEVIMLLLQYGADPFMERLCSHDPSQRVRPLECRLACSLTACRIGSTSPYPRVRQLFRDLGR